MWIGEVLAEVAHHPSAGAEPSIGHLGGDEHGCGAEDDGDDDADEDHGDGVDDASALGEGVDEGEDGDGTNECGDGRASDAE